MLEVRREQWQYTQSIPLDARHYRLGDVVACKFLRDGSLKVLHLFAEKGDYDIEERLILFLSWVRTEFSAQILSDVEALTWLCINSSEKKWSDILLEQFSLHSLAPETKIQKEASLISLSGNRIDFRNWYTLTIDGSDAKDLDDAISLAAYPDGAMLLGVHIADVAQYVHEGTPLDKEAYARATSVYTPGKVIPMLPEKISNDLCSLHPGWPKVTLSCLMRVNPEGEVLQADIVEGIIESQKKGVYEDIYISMKGDVWGEKNGASPLSGVHSWNQPFKKGGKGNFSSHQEQATLSLAFELFEILKKRRKKEGKIIFESTEIRFSWDTRTSISVEKRARNDSHMMIEEFMVLANEEVAKWCIREELPFLSRAHALPSSENIALIALMIDNAQIRKKLEPHHIRSYMEKMVDPVEQFRLSHLLLPKMAKAIYTDKVSGHFGLALSHYSHFTSPIRRYPDLQVHRIIKEKLHSTLSSERKAHYRSILKRVAKHCSEQERFSEDVERAFDVLYACRYMQNKVGQIFSGQVSWVTDFAVFVELQNGIEWTLYLPRKRFQINQLDGSISDGNNAVLYRIGDAIKARVEEVNMNEKRIILKQAQN